MGGEQTLNDYKKGFEKFHQYIKEKNSEISGLRYGGVTQQPQTNYQISYEIYPEHRGYFVDHKKFKYFEKNVNNPHNAEQIKGE